jgi:hypothetical protein
MKLQPPGFTTRAAALSGDADATEWKDFRLVSLNQATLEGLFLVNSSGAGSLYYSCHYDYPSTQVSSKFKGFGCLPKTSPVAF